MHAMLFLALAACEAEMPCNGSTGICHKRLNEITVAGAHNAMASADAGFFPPNHNLGIAAQLRGGIRGLNIDLYRFEDTVYMCHFDCALGKTPLLDGLKTIDSFLMENPREMIVITFQSGLDADSVMAVFEESGLISRLHEQELGTPWPTIESLIEAEKNIVVFSDREGGQHGGYHDQWTYWIDNPYQATELDEFSCIPDRGNSDTATLYNINHFITDPIAFESRATDANAFEILEEHAYRCMEETGFFPNQILVDFWSIGGLISLVDQLNELE